MGDIVKTRIAGRVIETGVGLAHRSPRVRGWLLDRMTRHLDASYSEWSSDREILRLHRWFANSLRPFVERLIVERPRAAKAIGRFVYAWARDVARRSRSRAPDRCAPCTVVIEATDRCNLRCPGCYASSTREGSDLPYDLLAELVAQSADMGVTLITISGGEPFMREREDLTLTRLARSFPDLGFLVYTNGTLIDDEIARRLYEVGNIFPAISVEGYQRETDARRGRGCYARTRAVRDLLARHEIMYGFSATVTSRNAELIASDEFIQRRIEEGDLFGWFFLYQPIGRQPDPALMVSAEQRAALREKIYQWRAEGKPIFLGDFWNDGVLSHGCLAGGTRYFHIYANGDISPCVFSPVACGNIRDIVRGTSPYRSLADLVNHHPFFVGFREKQRQIEDYRAPCMLIDHPDLFRELCRQVPFYSAKNMADGYLDGAIAREIDRRAAEWREKIRGLPYLPECVRLAPAEQAMSESAAR